MRYLDCVGEFNLIDGIVVLGDHDEVVEVGARVGHGGSGWCAAVARGWVWKTGEVRTAAGGCTRASGNTSSNASSSNNM